MKITLKKDSEVETIKYDSEIYPEEISENDKASILFNIKMKSWALFGASLLFIGISIYLLIASHSWKPALASVVVAVYTAFLGWQKNYILKHKRFVVVECLCTNLIAAGIRNRDARYSFLIIDDTENMNTFDLCVPKRSKYNKNISYYFCFSTDKNGYTDYTKNSLITSIRKTPAPEINKEKTM